MCTLGKNIHTFQLAYIDCVHSSVSCDVKCFRKVSCKLLIATIANATVTSKYCFDTFHMLITQRKPQLVLSHRRSIPNCSKFVVAVKTGEMSSYFLYSTSASCRKSSVFMIWCNDSCSGTLCYFGNSKVKKSKESHNKCFIIFIQQTLCVYVGWKWKLMHRDSTSTYIMIRQDYYLHY